MSAKKNKATATSGEPTVMLTAAGANRLRQGAPWIFRKDVDRAIAVQTFSPSQLPFVRVVDQHHNAIVTALWSNQGAIALRRWGALDTPTDENEIKRRLMQALNQRRILMPNAQAYRLVHGEADELPGLFVDRYAQGLVVQTACQAAQLMLPTVVQFFLDEIQPSLIIRRDDGSIRDMEQLPREKEILHGGPSTIICFREGDVLLEVDLLHGHKTGTYLDQQENHILAGSLAQGRCLDLFCCEGGFALHLARRADSVIAVDQDPAVIERLKRNAELNNLSQRIDARATNAFDLLRELDEAQEKFDCIVVDPPALAKRSSSLDAALRGYFELNRRALRLCKSGGYLFTLSCSGKVTIELLEDAVRRAANQSRRRARVLMRRFAGPDHPGLLGMPESEYLKGLVLQII